VGIIVPRIGSTRVPGKFTLDSNGIPTIERIIRNVLKVSILDEVCKCYARIPDRCLNDKVKLFLDAVNKSEGE